MRHRIRQNGSPSQNTTKMAIAFFNRAARQELSMRVPIGTALPLNYVRHFLFFPLLRKPGFEFEPLYGRTWLSLINCRVLCTFPQALFLIAASCGRTTPEFWIVETAIVLSPPLRTARKSETIYSSEGKRHQCRRREWLHKQRVPLDEACDYSPTKCWCPSTDTC